MRFVTLVTTTLHRPQAAMQSRRANRAKAELAVKRPRKSPEPLTDLPQDEAKTNRAIEQSRMDFFCEEYPKISRVSFFSEEGAGLWVPGGAFAFLEYKTSVKRDASDSRREAVTVNPWMDVFYISEKQKIRAEPAAPAPSSEKKLS